MAQFVDVQNGQQIEFLHSFMNKFPGGQSVMKQVYKDSRYEMLPGVFNDLKYDAFAREFADRYVDTKPKHVDGILVGSDLLGPMNQLLQRAGHPGNPMGSAWEGRRGAKIPDRFKEILTWVTQLYTAFFIPTPVRITHISRSGMPVYSRSIDYKFDMIKKNISRFDDIIKDISKCVQSNGDLYHFARKYDIFPVTSATRRLQETLRVDYDGSTITGKEKEVIDFYGNKVLQKRDIHGTNLLRVRARVAWAIPTSINALLGYYAMGVQEYAKRTYKFTYSHDGDELSQKIRAHTHIVGIDVANFDANYSLELIDHVIESMDIFDDEIKSMMKWIIHLPLYLQHDYVGKYGRKLVGDLRRWSEEVFIGNPSGWAMVSNFNKIMGTAISLYAIDHIDRLSKDKIHKIMLGEDPEYVCLNAGDDNLLCMATAEKCASVKKVVNNMTEPFKLEIESVTKFVGRVFYREHENSTIISLPDVRNLVVKMMVPERDINAPSRKLFRLGYAEKLAVYSKCPSYQQIYRDMMELIQKHFDVNIEGGIFTPTRDDFLLLSKRSSRKYNIAEQEFMEDPEKIHYKLDPADIGEDLLSLFYLSINPEQYIGFDRHVKKDRMLHDDRRTNVIRKQLEW